MTLEAMQVINQEVANCKKCPLFLDRKFTVPGHGNFIWPDYMFISEAPGAQEDSNGLPFQGRAGAQLDFMLQSIGLVRSQVFITNVLKCRPPGNRDPRPNEIEECSPYLARQIELVNPSIIVPMGRFATSLFIPGAVMQRVHGELVWANGKWVVPLYHPAAGLHQPSLRRTIEMDFLRLPGFLAITKRPQVGVPKKDEEGFSLI